MVFYRTILIIVDSDVVNEQAAATRSLSAPPSSGNLLSYVISASVINCFRHALYALDMPHLSRFHRVSQVEMILP